MRDNQTSLETASVQLERLYSEHAGLLRTTAKFRHRIPPEDIDELVHDVFVSWLERQPRVNDLRAYFLAATNNACMYYWRKRSRSVPLLEEHAEMRDDSSAIAVDRWIVHLSLAAMLAELGPKCRETLRRYYLEQQPPEAIAANLETTRKYVFQLLHTCRKQAREIYRRLTEPSQ
jgi:RNA polymerase sigma factor (sigma-70 family)